jgi:hypothetical protein
LHIHGFSGTRKRILVKRLSRSDFPRLMRELPVCCEAVMEARGSGHFRVRFVQGQRYRALLFPPQHVRAYVVATKTEVCEPHKAAQKLKPLALPGDAY